MCLEKKIIKMLAGELKLHPEAQLIDLYKLYMQSAFGPGHLIKDTDSAKNYLKTELEGLTTEKQRYDIFPCDAFFPYSRYSLHLIKENKVSFEDFFTAFIRTANECQPPAEDIFLQGWQVALEYLSEKNISNFTGDKHTIDTLFADKKYLVSHSNHYRELYKPAYRIIGNLPNIQLF